MFNCYTKNVSENFNILQEKFEDTKGVFWRHKPKKDRQIQYQKEKEQKEQTVIYKTQS